MWAFPVSTQDITSYPGIMGLVSSFLLFSVIAVYFSNPSNALTCTTDPDNTCKCHLSDGADGIIDLSNLFSGGPVKASGEGYNFELNGCSDVPPCKGCDGNCLVCQVSSDGKSSFGVGGSKDVTFDVSGSDPANNLWKINVSYEGGAQGRHSAVEYDHSSTTSFNFISESPQLFYHMKLAGPFSVPGGGGGGGGSGGSGGPSAVNLAGIPGIILIVVLLLAIVAYVVIGIGVNAGIRHKQGIEMIPNVEFWKDFPFLLKDGVVFTFTYPCKKISGYNKI